VYSSLAQRNLRQVVGRCLYSRPVPSSAPTLPVGGAMQLTCHEAFAILILSKFPAHDLIEIDDMNWNFGFAEMLECQQPSFAGDQPSIWGNSNRMQEPNFGDALGEGLYIAEGLSKPIAANNACNDGGRWRTIAWRRECPPTERIR
jgi:hypothetical protein